MVMLLTALGWLMCVADLSGSAGSSAVARTRRAADVWRRTAEGWEKSTEWRPVELTRRPPFHPGLLAAFEAWTAVAVLVCTRPQRRAANAVVSETGVA